MDADELALNLALDADPSDADTRCVLADWYEERGMDEDADRERWLAGAGKWPHQGVDFWHWFGDHHAGIFAEYPEAMLLEAVYFACQEFATYHTRRDAEADLWRVRGAYDAAAGRG